MKCLKNRKTSNIVRISDQQAHQMIGSQWTYTSKEEWKSAVRPRTAVEIMAENISKAVDEMAVEMLVKYAKKQKSK
jgi:hypothetical protein